MKKYITVKVWNHDTTPSVVGHFDTAEDAQAFAELSHKTDTEYNYAVYTVVFTTAK
jgi:hypothetical protein